MPKIGDEMRMTHPPGEVKFYLRISGLLPLRVFKTFAVPFSGYNQQAALGLPRDLNLLAGATSCAAAGPDENGAASFANRFLCAGVAELADAPDSKSGAPKERGGSTPPSSIFTNASPFVVTKGFEPGAVSSTLTRGCWDECFSPLLAKARRLPYRLRARSFQGWPRCLHTGDLPTKIKLLCRCFEKSQIASETDNTTQGLSDD